MDAYVPRIGDAAPLDGGASKASDGGAPDVAKMAVIDAYIIKPAEAVPPPKDGWKPPKHLELKVTDVGVSPIGLPPKLSTTDGAVTPPPAVIVPAPMIPGTAGDGGALPAPAPPTFDKTMPPPTAPSTPWDVGVAPPVAPPAPP